MAGERSFRRGDLASAGMAAATTATDALRHELEHPAAAMHALGVLQDVKARLEAWAAAQPPAAPLATWSGSVPRTGSPRPVLTAAGWQRGWPAWSPADIAAAYPARACTRGERWSLICNANGPKLR
jgi:hypothetical protein